MFNTFWFKEMFNTCDTSNVSHVWHFQCLTCFGSRKCLTRVTLPGHGETHQLPPHHPSSKVSRKEFTRQLEVEQMLNAAGWRIVWHIQMIFKHIHMIFECLSKYFVSGSCGWQNFCPSFDFSASLALSDMSASGRKSLWVIFFFCPGENSRADLLK